MPKKKFNLDSVPPEPKIYRPNDYGTKRYGYFSDAFEPAADVGKRLKQSFKSMTNQQAVATPYRGVPVKDKTVKSYIGGTKDEVRDTFWREEPIMQSAVDSIAGSYGINPELLKNRINKEGFTDAAINMRNYAIQYPNFADINDYSGYGLLHNPKFGAGAALFGLDDVGSFINDGKINLINEGWYSEDFKNEHGRSTNTVSSDDFAGNAGIMAATLKYLRDQAAKDYPNATPQELDNYANIYYNRGIEGARSYINSGKGSVRYTKAFGGAIKPRRSLRSGGAIHINPANRGKFNATKERTGKTTEELTHSKNPLTRKRAIFAQNAAKWNH